MSRLLRVDLPDDVWARLNAEAAAADQKIGLFVKHLILARDSRKNPVSDTSDT